MLKINKVREGRDSYHYSFNIMQTSPQIAETLNALISAEVLLAKVDTPLSARSQQYTPILDI